MSSQGLRNVPIVLGVRKKVFTKRLAENIARFELRKGEYAVQAINVVLAAMDVIINEDSWLPALRAKLGAPLQENHEQQPCTDIVLSVTADDALQITRSPAELTLLLHARDEEISDLKDKLSNSRAELRNLQRRFDRLQQRSDCLVQRNKEPEEALAITKLKSGRNLSQSSVFAVAIRRNFSNIAAADLGAVLLMDVSRQTVVRCEVAAGAALLGSAHAFWQAEQDAEQGDGREVLEDAEENLDDDGAVVFEGVARERRQVRLPPDVPVPSQEMMRRHRAAGH